MSSDVGLPAPSCMLDSTSRDKVDLIRSRMVGWRSMYVVGGSQPQAMPKTTSGL
jgi:hypothetical protein